MNRSIRRIALGAVLLVVASTPASASPPVVAHRSESVAATAGQGAMVACDGISVPDARVAALVAQVCGTAPANGVPVDFPCDDSIDVYYNKYTTTVDGVPTSTRFLNFHVSASFACRQPILECVVVALVGGAPATVLGWGGPLDGSPTGCVVGRTYPDSTGPVPSGAVIVAGVFTLTREIGADWHAYFIT